MTTASTPKPRRRRVCVLIALCALAGGVQALGPASAPALIDSRVGDECPPVSGGDMFWDDVLQQWCGEPEGGGESGGGSGDGGGGDDPEPDWPEVPSSEPVVVIHDPAAEAAVEEPAPDPGPRPLGERPPAGVGNDGGRTRERNSTGYRAQRNRTQRRQKGAKKPAPKPVLSEWDRLDPEERIYRCGDLNAWLAEADEIVREMRGAPLGEERSFPSTHFDPDTLKSSMGPRLRNLGDAQAYRKQLRILWGGKCEPAPVN